MAIQIPNPGTGNGATGDNEFVLWSKVKDNFSDQTNAASRLVGTAKGNVVLFDNAFKATHSFVPRDVRGLAETDCNNLEVGDFVIVNSATTNAPTELISPTAVTLKTSASINIYKTQTAVSINNNASNLHIRHNNSVGFTAWATIYSNANTTKDSNGFIKAASPIVKVFADKVELNDDAERQNVTYKKNGIGDYTITTVSGLSTDGWYIELPKDMNGNPKVAVTLQETNGVISLKTYKRIFSMETFTFEPDLDNPLDIPDTRWIDLRLNEIPVEMPDDTQMEV